MTSYAPNYKRPRQPKTARVRGGAAGSQTAVSNLPTPKQPSSYKNPVTPASPLTSSLYGTGPTTTPNSIVPTTGGGQAQSFTGALGGNMTGWKAGDKSNVAQKTPGGIPGMDQQPGGVPGMNQQPGGMPGMPPQPSISPSPTTSMMPPQPSVQPSPRTDQMYGQGTALPSQVPSVSTADFYPDPLAPGNLPVMPTNPIQAHMTPDELETVGPPRAEFPTSYEPTVRQAAAAQPLGQALTGQEPAAQPAAAAAQPLGSALTGKQPAAPSYVSSMQAAPAKAAPAKFSPYQVATHKRSKAKRAVRESTKRLHRSLLGMSSRRRAEEMSKHRALQAASRSAEADFQRITQQREQQQPAAVQPAVQPAVEPAVEPAVTEPVAEKPRFAEVGEAAAEPVEDPQAAHEAALAAAQQERQALSVDYKRIQTDLQDLEKKRYGGSGRRVMSAKAYNAKKLELENSLSSAGAKIHDWRPPAPGIGPPARSPQEEEAYQQHLQYNKMGSRKRQAAGIIRKGGLFVQGTPEEAQQQRYAKEQQGYSKMSQAKRQAAGIIRKDGQWVQGSPEELEEVREQREYGWMSESKRLNAGIIQKRGKFVKGTPEELESARKKKKDGEDAKWERQGYDPQRMRGMYGKNPEILQRLRGIEQREPADKWDNFDWKSKIDPNKEYLYGGTEKVTGKSIIMMHDWGLGIDQLKDDLRLTTNIDGSVLYPPDEKFEAVPQEKAPTPPTIEVQQAWEDQGGKGLAPQGWQSGAAVEQPVAEEQPVVEGQPATAAEGIIRQDSIAQEVPGEEAAARPEYSRQAQWEAAGRTGDVPRWYAGQGSWEEYDAMKVRRDQSAKDSLASRKEAFRVKTAEREERGTAVREKSPWITAAFPRAMLKTKGPGPGTEYEGVDFKNLGGLSVDQLDSIMGMDDDELEDALGGIKGKGMLYKRGKHAMRAKASAELEKIRRSEAPDKWEKTDWQATIQDDQKYVFRDSFGSTQETTGKSVKMMAGMGLNMDMMNDIFRLLKNEDGSYVFPT